MKDGREEYLLLFTSGMFTGTVIYFDILAD